MRINVHCLIPFAFLSSLVAAARSAFSRARARSTTSTITRSLAASLVVCSLRGKALSQQQAAV
jgi:hypothetical protein